MKPGRYVAFAITLILWFAGDALIADELNFPPPRYRMLALEVLKEIVAIDTSEPHGSTEAAEALAARFRSAGWPEQELFLLTPPDHPQKGNLVVRLRGQGRARPLLWIAHLDVVDADPRYWSLPPFELRERDGWYYGRGTADMKGEIAAITAALIRLKEEGFVPDRDIIATFTADEEAEGTMNGVRWLLAEHRPLVSAEIALNPDAGGGEIRAARKTLYGVQTLEKTYASYTLTAQSAGGHSSRPRPENAIYRLSAALLRVSQHRFPLRVTETVRRFLTQSAKLAPDATGRDMLAVADAEPDAGAAERLSANPTLNALLHTTCVATLVAAGEVENALPQRARAVIQCRLLPEETPEAMRRALQQLVADPQVEVALLRPVNPAPETLPDPRVMRRITDVVDSMWPGTPVTTKMDPGGSDSIFTRGAGIPTYGVQSIFEDIDDVRNHGRDERISRQAFHEGVEFTWRLMRTLSAQPGRPVVE